MSPQKPLNGVASRPCNTAFWHQRNPQYKNGLGWVTRQCGANSMLGHTHRVISEFLLRVSGLQQARTHTKQKEGTLWACCRPAAWCILVRGLNYLQ